MSGRPSDRPRRRRTRAGSVPWRRAASSPRSSPNAVAACRWRSTSRGSNRSSRAQRRVQGCAWSAGGTTYFAHVDGLDPADLERAAGEAASALRGERGRAARTGGAPSGQPQPIEQPPRGGAGGAQGGAAARAGRARPGRGRRGRPVLASYAEARREVAVANSEGLFSGRRSHPGADRRPGGRPPRRRGRDRRRDAGRAPGLRAARRRPGGIAERQPARR